MFLALFILPSSNSNIQTSTNNFWIDNWQWNCQDISATQRYDRDPKHHSARPQKCTMKIMILALAIFCKMYYVPQALITFLFIWFSFSEIYCLNWLLWIYLARNSKFWLPGSLKKNLALCFMTFPGGKATSCSNFL